MNALYRSGVDGLENIEVACISPPGRGLRHSEPFVTDMATMVQHIVDAMIMFFDMPYGIFGHSMGSLIGYEVICEIARRGLPPPLFFVASAECAPHVLGSNADGHVDLALLRTLSDAAFVEKVGSEWGFMSLSDVADPAVLSVVLPPLRADLALLESYTTQQHRRVNGVRESDTQQVRVLPCPVVVLGGQEDSSISMDMLRTWEDCCKQKEDFLVQLFEGGHFYMEEHHAPVMAFLQRHVEVHPNATRTIPQILPCFTLPLVIYR